MKLIRTIKNGYLNINYIQSIYEWNNRYWCSTDFDTVEIDAETYNKLIENYGGM